ncbi:radical SAM domain-containing protein [Streptomyces sp. 769]|nr:radical SAM domain-containing protein [Streptomyces sp. 769]
MRVWVPRRVEGVRIGELFRIAAARFCGKLGVRREVADEIPEHGHPAGVSSLIVGGPARSPVEQSEDRKAACGAGRSRCPSTTRSAAGLLCLGLACGALHHLEPAGGDDRFTVQRFAPYFENPPLGFHERWAAPQYGLTYDLPEQELFGIAYIFKATHQGIGNDMAWKLRAAMDTWRDGHRHSQLSYFETEESITLTNTRPGFDWHVIQLTTDVEIALFQLLDQPRSLPYLERECAKRLGQTDVGAVIDRWMEPGLLFTDDGRLIHVVTKDRNQRFMQIRVGQGLAARSKADRPSSESVDGARRSRVVGVQPPLPPVGPGGAARRRGTEHMAGEIPRGQVLPPSRSRVPADPGPAPRRSAPAHGLGPCLCLRGRVADGRPRSGLRAGRGDVGVRETSPGRPDRRQRLVGAVPSAAPGFAVLGGMSVYISIVLWNLKNSKATVEDLREYLRDYAVDAFSTLKGMRMKT